jgi:hypothetical protein
MNELRKVPFGAAGSMEKINDEQDLDLVAQGKLPAPYGHGLPRSA